MATHRAIQPLLTGIRCIPFLGSDCQPLGNGISDIKGLYVYALTVYNNQLIVGGDFTTDRGGIANRIARWDGTSWHPLGSGMNNVIFDMAVYNGQLIAGG
jgi:hypothetical protein